MRRESDVKDQTVLPHPVPCPRLRRFAQRTRSREILRFAEEHDEPIVIGGRGLSRVEGFFLGGVSQEIMEKAKGTVLIVK